METDVYLVQVVDNGTTDIFVKNKTNSKLKLRITVSKENNQGSRDTKVSQVTLNRRRETIRNIGNAVPNTLCILEVEIIGNEEADFEDGEFEVIESSNKEGTTPEIKDEEIIKESTDLIVIEDNDISVNEEKKQKGIIGKIFGKK